VDDGAADRLGQMALATTGRADKEGVLVLGDEARGGELVDEGAIRIEERPRGSVKQRVTIPLRKADLKSFTQQELDVIDEVVATLKQATARHISRVSHVRSPGWNLVRQDEDIPYSTALVDIEPPSEQTLTRFRALAAERGW